MTEQEYKERIGKMIRESSKWMDHKLYIPKESLKGTRLKKLKQIENRKIMKDVVIQETDYNNGKGKVAIFNYLGKGDPMVHLDRAIQQYTRGESYTEFIDANMDNPWVSIIIKGNVGQIRESLT